MNHEDTHAQAARSGRGESRPKMTLHPRLLLLACLFGAAPLYPPNTRLLFALAGAHNAVVGNYLLGTSLAIGLLGAVFGLWSMFGRKKQHAFAGFAGWMRLLAGVVYALATVAFAMLAVKGTDASGISSVLGFALGLLAGAGLVAALFAWARLFPADLRGVLLHGALVCSLSALINWLLTVLPGPIALTAMAALSAVGALAPVLARSTPAAAPLATDGANTKNDLSATNAATKEGFLSALRDLLSIVWVPLVGLLALTFIMNLYTFPVERGALGSENLGALIAAALAVTVCLFGRSTPLAITVERLVFPICVAVCVLLASMPASSALFRVGALTVFTPMIFVSVYALAELVAVSKAGEFPASFIFGVTLFAASIASIAGMTASSAIPDMGEAAQLAQLVATMYWVLVIIELAVSSWRHARSEGEGDIVIASVGTAALSNNLLDASKTTAPVNLDQRAAALAHEYGLTARETEILGYLAHGHNSTYIAKSLYISANTVRTHIYNLYRKVGVTSREQLLEKLES